MTVTHLVDAAALLDAVEDRRALCGVRLSSDSRPGDVFCPACLKQAGWDLD